VTYRLVVLTNGRDCLRETLAAFRELADPQPAEVHVVVDGGESAALDLAERRSGDPWHVHRIIPAIGFCRATRWAWSMAAGPGPEFVFWLEDDIVLLRRVELAHLADVLRRKPRLTQMALMRGPANDLEEAAGGCRALRPDDYVEGDGWHPWLESRTNHSTGCSLIRRAFMEAEPWPKYDENCEGRFSIDLLAKGYRFGVWGLGEPWVEHVGRRAGFGY